MKFADKLKTTHTSKNYFFPSYFGFIQTRTISRVHSCIAKKSSHASHAFVFGVFFLEKNYRLLLFVKLIKHQCPSVRFLYNLRFLGEYICVHSYD